MRKAAVRGIGPVIAILFVFAAVRVIQEVLAQYDLAGIVSYLRELPLCQVLLALLCAGLSYLVMTAYDLLAMRYIHRPLAWFKVSFAAFVSYAFSNTVGLSVLTSGSVRYRFYSAWGLSWKEVTQIVIFTALTMWLGILAIAGGILILQPLSVPGLSYLPFADSPLVGWGMLALPVAYLVVGIRCRQPLQVWRWRVPIARPGLACLQVGVGALDWVMASTVLYVLLPPAETLNFSHFLGIFLVAQTVALISHVPGGLGVFESLILLMLSAYIPTAQVFGALLAYRLIFYFLPLGLATLGLSIHEGWRQRARITELARMTTRIAAACLPANPR